MKKRLQSQVSQKIVAGIDVAGKELEVAVEPQAGRVTVAYTDDGLPTLVAWLRERNVAHVCLEATGGIERGVVAVLREHGFVVSVVNPRCVRDFARALGQLAKTDRIDARVLALFAAKIEPQPTPESSPNQDKLQALQTRRRQLVEMLTQERNRLLRTWDRDVRTLIQKSCEQLQTQLDEIERQIRELLQAQEFAEKAALLTSVKGIGDTTAAMLLANLPELGRFNRQQIARLVGLAPINRDSGTLRGKRLTGGGRTHVRTALFLPTLVATRRNPQIKAFYHHLLQKGKSKMTALVACMRKLLTTLNAILKSNVPWALAPKNA